MVSKNLLKICIFCAIVKLAVGMYDDPSYDNGEQKANNYLDNDDEADLRLSRNDNWGNSPNQGPRFGWQNPILVAPTLGPSTNGYPTTPRQISPFPTTRRPTNPYPTTRRPINPYPTTRRPYQRPGQQGQWTTATEDPYLTSGSNQNAQYVRPPGSGQGGQWTPVAEPQVGGQKCTGNYRSDKQSGQCVELGSPCGENMAFYEDPTSKGIAECHCRQDRNRPLVYLKGKCYFVFQQAFCKPSEWLIPTPDGPICSRNPCQNFVTEKLSSPWNWSSNGATLDNYGPVALISERQCSILGSDCNAEGNEPQLFEKIQAENTNSGIQLGFEGAKLACRRDLRGRETKKELTLACKQGLWNKWKMEGRCGR